MIYIIPWETSGTIVVEASSPEEAKKLAERNWDKEIQNYSEHEVSFDPPVHITSLKQAYALDYDIQDVDGDCSVYGGNKSLRDYFPSATEEFVGESPVAESPTPKLPFFQKDERQEVCDRYIKLIELNLNCKLTKTEYEFNADDAQFVKEVEDNIFDAESKNSTPEEVDNLRRTILAFTGTLRMRGLKFSYDSNPTLKIAILQYLKNKNAN